MLIIVLESTFVHCCHGGRTQFEWQQMSNQMSERDWRGILQNDTMHYGGEKNAVSKLIWKGLLQDFSFTATFCSALLKPHFPQCTQMTGPQQTMFHSLIFLQQKNKGILLENFFFLLFFNSAQWLQAPQQQILLMLDGLWLYESIARVQF